MVLFVNACVRAGHSRTLRLANVLLKQLNEPFTELVLSDITFQPVDYSYIQTRDLLLSEDDYGHPMFDLARQFAAADTIVIATPFWDLSFPAMLKQYFEQINAIGITFKYTERRLSRRTVQSQKAVLCNHSWKYVFPRRIWIRVHSCSCRKLLRNKRMHYVHGFRTGY